MLNSALDRDGNRGSERPEVHPQDYYDTMLLPSLVASRSEPAARLPSGTGRALDESGPPTIEDPHGLPFLGAQPDTTEPPERPIVAPRGDDRTGVGSGEGEPDRQSPMLAVALLAAMLCGLGRSPSKAGRWTARRAPRRTRRAGVGPRT